jgi:putative transposase
MPLYHVWFATKRRKWLLQEEVGKATKDLIWAVAKDKNVRLLECETIVDHVHLLIAAEDAAHLSKAMNLLKGITSRRILEKFPELRLDARVGAFWQHRYAAKAVPERAVPSVGRYIRTQWDRLEKYER